ncbi:MAG TPA: DUF3180 domain-containing protein [Propionibacteriaceae bacterium]|nr:DUF3180 domain-containing protein [Propionibacteriaceae bacterium]
MNRAFDNHPAAPPPSDRPTLTVTTGRQLVIAALSGAVFGWFLIETLGLADQTVPVTPWSLPLMLGALAVAAAVYGRRLRARIQDRREWVESVEGVRALVLGKTMAMTGSALAGGHAIYVLVNLSRFDAPTPRQRVVHGLVAIVAAAASGAAGWYLERSCVRPDDDFERDTAESDAS